MPRADVLRPFVSVCVLVMITLPAFAEKLRTNEDVVKPSKDGATAGVMRAAPATSGPSGQAVQTGAQRSTTESGAPGVTRAARLTSRPSGQAVQTGAQRSTTESGARGVMRAAPATSGPSGQAVQTVAPKPPL
jgi:hypothetical protein